MMRRTIIKRFFIKYYNLENLNSQKCSLPPLHVWMVDSSPELPLRLERWFDTSLRWKLLSNAFSSGGSRRSRSQTCIFCPASFPSALPLHRTQEGTLFNLKTLPASSDQHLESINKRLLLWECPSLSNPKTTLSKVSQDLPNAIPKFA